MSSANKTESLHFYDYLCHKIGSEKTVKVRRLTFIAADTSCCDNLRISSGSKSEGLDLNGSDIDLMLIDYNFIVYESERQAVQNKTVALYIDTDNTQTCFTRLHLYTNYNKVHVYWKMLEQHGLKFLLSSERYKQLYLNQFKSDLCSKCFISKIHGPCLSDGNDNYDFALCLKCDKWISQAVPWRDRPRSSWLSPDIISKITMSGVLFVPIGLKGSKYENLEWRISFSVAEKFLVFSFNHTQLLCYALLKIVLKEIIGKDGDLKDVLCSYYLKTLMFWISDDSDPDIWKPENLIKCFMACLQRLLYNVEYSTLLHYFIPDFNLFELRLGTELPKKKQLTNLLQNLYQQGIWCFAASETLHDYTRFSIDQYTHNQSYTTPRLEHDFLRILGFCVLKFHERSIQKLLNHLLHHSKTHLTCEIFQYVLSKAHQYVPHIYIKHKQNKQLYYRYKYEISRLLIGLHSDAVAGWLMLASFFYIHENYLTSLDLVNYSLSKLTVEKIDTSMYSIARNKLTPKQNSALNMMKKEKLITTLKSLTTDIIIFQHNSQIIPKELQKDVIRRATTFNPLPFAHFLRFLCCFHLHYPYSCKDAIQQLLLAGRTTHRESSRITHLNSFIFVGIAKQMMGETEAAKSCFEAVAESDHKNQTSAATRLLGLT